jgi:hypothetical protein
VRLAFLNATVIASIASSNLGMMSVQSAARTNGNNLSQCHAIGLQSKQSTKVLF